MVALLIFVPAERTRMTSLIWLGQFTRGRDDQGRAGTLCWPVSSLFKIGRTKAAVLPVPVMAVPIRSRPRKAAGMAASWMGVAVS